MNHTINRFAAAVGALSLFTAGIVPALAQDGTVVEVAPAGGQVTTTTKTTTTKTAAPPRTGTSITAQTPGGTTITVTVNDQAVPFAGNDGPVMLGGRVMVPLRGVIEKLGGSVLYDAKSQVITGANPETSKQFRLRVGSTSALANGQDTQLDTPPKVMRGTTYVPLRFVSEAMGAEVRWDNATRTVIIGSAGHAVHVSTGGKTAPE